jgi:hypothetical protein
MMKRPILLYLSPFVPVLTELANEAARCLIENRFAESLLGASQFSSLVSSGDLWRAQERLETKLGQSSKHLPACQDGFCRFQSSI